MPRLALLRALPLLLVGGLAGGLLLSACAAPVVSAQGEGEEAPSCATLSEAACLDSESCTLVPVEPEEGGGQGTGGYLCRPAEGPCETGFRQGSDSAEECEAKAGCRFVPGRCYCPPGVVCICGGGPPPQCIEVDRKDGKDGNHGEP